MSQSWRGGGPRVRFGDERKPIIERPRPLDSPLTCWCGERHPVTDADARYGTGLHPWPDLDDDD